jgi:antitoxin component of MazEF toxin-antitoxin module
MLRRVIVVGNSVAVTLPRDLLSTCGLEKGAIVEVRPAAGGLLIRPAVVQPVVVQPAVVQPAVVQPAVARPAMVRPAMVRPAMAQPTGVATATVRPTPAAPARRPGKPSRGSFVERLSRRMAGGIGDDPIAGLMHELKTRLARMYMTRLRDVQLFESYDRRAGLTVLVVLDRVRDQRMEIARVGPLVSRLALRHSLGISHVLVSEGQTGTFGPAV